MLKELSSDMEGTLKTPAANHLFMTYENCDILDEAKAQLFRHLMAKLLYLCRRTRHDIQKAIAFLCTRLNKLDKDEFKKLTRVMQYLCRTKNMKLTIDANEKLVGKNLYEIKDPSGKLIIQEIIKVVSSAQGSGWMEFDWAHPQTKKVESKISFNRKMKNVDGFIGTGIYPQ